MGTRRVSHFFHILLGLQAVLLVLLVARVSLSGFISPESPAIKTVALKRPVPAGIEQASASPSVNPWANDPEVLKALLDKSQALDKQKQQVEQKEKELVRIQLEIEGKINQLTQIHQQLKKIVEQSKAVQDKKIQHLAEIFCAMPPDKAARMIEKMDDRTVTEVFQSMRSKEVGGILSFLDPARAARISANLSLLNPKAN